MFVPSASSQARGAAYGLTAAALFGVSPPLAKLLLPEAGPLLIAGLLYLGAGLGLFAFELLFYRRSSAPHQEAPIRWSDARLLAGIILAGGALGPVLMLWGLERLSAVLASLLLNLEAPLTMVLAVFLFREHLGRWEVAGASLIFVGAAVLSYQPQALHGDVLGFLALLGACLCWAIDNNLMQQLSLRDPIVATRLKTLGAGTCTLSLAVATGQSLPSLSILLSALVLGLISYGLSLVLDMRALRILGAAREAGYFATAPFIGAVAAVPILGERWGTSEGLATTLMAAGLFLLLRERHSHEHAHDELEHDHAHVHGKHHEHGHDHAVIGQPHAHLHRHPPLVHDHPHVSELHHRHGHG